MWAPQDETQQLRFKQIDSLKQYSSTVKETVKDTLYEISTMLPSRKANITVRVNLPKDFPRVPPVLQIFPPVQHRLVDQQMYVVPAAHENLSRWGIHASLGKTVYEIIQKFIQEPPVILPQYTPSANLVSATPVISTISANPGQPVNNNIAPQPQPAQKVQTALPPVPSSFPELDAKSPSELTQLMTDEVEFKRFFENLPAVQTMKKVRDDLRDNNEILAKKNLAKEAEIESVKAELASVATQFSEKKNSYDKKAQRQQEIIKHFSTAALIEQLSEAAAEAESQSEATAKKFLSGDMDHKDFMKEFIEKRKLFHLRSAKKESLMMLVR